ncbi:MAG: hypothetical protein LUH48_01020 [Clostridiales bacterium]|nr:hypothetical protein [Clostridiales bacterium]
MKFILLSLGKIGVFVLIWASLSISGVLLPPLRWEQAVETWNAIQEAGTYMTSSGGFAYEQYAKSAENTTFAAGCYDKYVGNRTDGNLQATDQIAACVSEDTLYFIKEGYMLQIEYSSHNEFTKVGTCDTAQAMVAGMNSLFGVDGESMTFHRTQNYAAYTLEDTGWRSGYDEADFPALADALYALLVKQETESLSAEEFAALVYYTSDGTLLGWVDGAAWLADDRSVAGQVTIYEQTAEGVRTEKISYVDNYDGVGAGRFLAEGMIVYIEDEHLNLYLLDGSRYSCYAQATVRSLNYLYMDDVFYIVWTDDENVVFFDYLLEWVSTSNISSLEQEGCSVTGTICFRDMVIVCTSDSDFKMYHHNV